MSTPLANGQLGANAAKDYARVLDDARRQALRDVDNAPFSWFHVKLCVVAGVGFFTDAYDIFAINIASTMLGYVYGHNQMLNSNQDLAVKVATPIGTLVGQLLFGWLADIVGRKKMYGVELMIIIASCFGQAVTTQGNAVTVIGVLVVWRFVMGVGIGGDYPLSAVICSEFSPTYNRGRLMTAVFSMQGFGNFTAALVAFIVTEAFKSKLLHDPPNDMKSIDYMWRLLVGLGCVPAVFALFYRLAIPETPRFTMDIHRNIDQARLDIQRAEVNKHGSSSKVAHDALIRRVELQKASLHDFFTYFNFRDRGHGRHNFKVLFGCAYSWFALDIAFYGLGLNSSIILQAIGFGTPPQEGHIGAYLNLRNVCIGNIIISIAGLIPGYGVAWLFIDKWGRIPMQLMGFIVLTVLFIIMGFAYDALTETVPGTKWFVFLYCLANFFQNFGPNTTTFIIPGEVFPTRYRSTCNGISAASGKLGAIVAQVGFANLKDIGGTNKFVKHILQIFAFFMLTGIFSTFLLPETMQQSLEDLSNENQEGFVMGIEGLETARPEAT